MGTKSNRILRPDLSLRDNVELAKLLERAAKQRAAKHLTRVGLNSANVQNADVTRSKVPLSQRREDYVKVPEWSTRAVMEQLPSIQRDEQRARELRVQWLGAKNVTRRVFANLPSTIAREEYNKELRLQGSRVLKYLMRANPQAAQFLTKIWFGA